MARYHIGVIYERLGDLKTAAREFQRSLDDGVGEASSLFHLARIRKSEGDEVGAKVLMERARQFARANAV